MSSYCNTRVYPLRYTDYDFCDRLKPSALLALAQESAGASADELGFGYEALKPLGFGFITVATHCEFRKPVALLETLTVETWPLPPRHVIFERDYRVKDSKGEEVAAIASRWCLVDLSTFSLLPPSALKEVHERCPYRAEKTVEVPNWKIARCGGEGREVAVRRIRNSDCDHYFHANNTKYADFFFDCFSARELERPVKAFRISYVKQAKEGDELSFFRADREHGSVLEATQGGALTAQCEIQFE